MKSIKSDGFINKNTFTKIQQIMRNNNDSIISGVGVQINDSNGNVIWMPPQSKEEVLKYLDELEIFINNDNKYPLIKMAIIHYQFEAIHPYNDGNGQTGRIINILYLIMCKVIGSPFIPLSQQIQKTKSQYYQLLQDVNKNEENITQFIIYILENISSASDTSSKILLDLQLLFKSINNNKT
ncbi:MAG: Fic family protein [Mycoplasmataceae bacterium]|nr:Fic family protein [Mycoplasmataceae bacterium]